MPGMHCSHLQPVLPDSAGKSMSQCLCFLFNIVYTCNSAHEEEKSCMDMFAFMLSLDTKVSYKYEVVLARPVLKLLAHPWQQPCQCHTFYSLLEDDEEPTETKVTV